MSSLDFQTFDPKNESFLPEVLDAGLQQSPSSENANEKRIQILQIMKKDLGCFWANNILERAVEQLYYIDTNENFFAAIRTFTKTLERTRKILEGKGLVEYEDPLEAIEFNEPDVESRTDLILESQKQQARLNIEKREELIEILNRMLKKVRERYNEVLTKGRSLKTKVTRGGEMNFTQDEEAEIFGDHYIPRSGKHREREGVLLGVSFPKSYRRNFIEFIKDAPRGEVIKYEEIIKATYTKEGEEKKDFETRKRDIIQLMTGVSRKLVDAGKESPYKTIPGEGIILPIEPTTEKDEPSNTLGLSTEFLENTFDPTEGYGFNNPDFEPEEIDSDFDHTKLELEESLQLIVRNFLSKGIGTGVQLSSTPAIVSTPDWKPTTGEAMNHIKDNLEAINTAMSEAEWGLKLVLSGGSFILQKED